MDDTKFKKILRIAELIEQPSHNESEIEEIVEYLRTFDRIKD